MAYEYPIGTPNVPWGKNEKAEWLAAQNVKRSYAEEVLAKIGDLDNRFEILKYGELPYDEQRYPLYAVKTKDWNDNLPAILVTGGVHGYETSGVQGALLFLKDKAKSFQEYLKVRTQQINISVSLQIN